MTETITPTVSPRSTSSRRSSSPSPAALRLALLAVGCILSAACTTTAQRAGASDSPILRASADSAEIMLARPDLSNGRPVQVALASPASIDQLASYDFLSRIDTLRQKTNVRWSCVPFARELSGLDIKGNAHLWWQEAEGRYDRGHTPAPGAVLVLKRNGVSRYGHVAVVSRVVGPREILVHHANWGWNRATRGRMHWNMRVLDVSPNNDWSQTKFWYEPGNQWGSRTYAAYGFIYAPNRGGSTMVADASAGR